MTMKGKFWNKWYPIILVVFVLLGFSTMFFTNSFSIIMTGIMVGVIAAILLGFWLLRKAASRMRSK